jgi:hypothetical protein
MEFGVPEYCALSELHPASAGLGMLSGRSRGVAHPGLKKPWAILCDHFMVKNPRPPINHHLLTISDY